MENEKLNRALHEAMVGCASYPPDKWWELSAEERICTRCGVHCAEHKPFNPEYSTSLDAVAEVEAFVIEKVGKNEYVRCLIGATKHEIEPAIRAYADDAQALLYSFQLVATASALDRAKACLAALGLEGK